MNSAGVIILNEVIFTVFLQQQSHQQQQQLQHLVTIDYKQTFITFTWPHGRIQGNVDHLHQAWGNILEPSNNIIYKQ